MSEIRRLIDTDFDAWLSIADNAYPAFASQTQEAFAGTKERLLKIHAQVPTINFYGLFRYGQLVGGMRFHDFTMNFRDTLIPACGVGMVAVDLLHKKEHIAKEMLEYFLRYYRQRDITLAMLYPFRPDFYKKMGFGYGSQAAQYRVRPAAFPRGTSKQHIRPLNQTDSEALQACFNRLARRTHGMIEKVPYEVDKLFRNSKNRFVGYEKDGQLQGYIVFTFVPGDTFLTNDIHIHEFIYENREALSELLTFLHTQADQIHRIILETQDPTFYFLLSDVGNGSNGLIPSVYHTSSEQGMGLMYRVLNVPAIFEQLKGHNFGGQTCRLRLEVVDTFLPENAGATYLHFKEGKLHTIDDNAPYDITIKLDISGFSSLLAGSITFQRLYLYHQAEISDPAWLPIIDKLFSVPHPPICATGF